VVHTEYIYFFFSSTEHCAWAIISPKEFKSCVTCISFALLYWNYLLSNILQFYPRPTPLICHLILTKINCITLKICSKADFKSKLQNIWEQIIPVISLKYLFPEKMFIEICCQNWQKCNTICVTTFFYWISRVCQKKIKYIHQNLRY
jgi:hypothetical protein